MPEMLASCFRLIRSISANVDFLPATPTPS
jgi:hypothetical protein